MNKKGFTLVELLATLVILGVVIGIAFVASSTIFKNAKGKTEGVFVKTIEDAINVFMDSSEVRKMKFSKNSVKCTLSKTHGNVKVYTATSNITFENVINSSYSPITLDELVNPANKNSDDPTHPYQCLATGILEVYRDEDYVYYYRISKRSFGCLNDKEGYITNLPSGC